MRRVLAGLPVLAGLALAVPALADEWSDQVLKLIDAAAETYFAKGYRYGGYTHEGSLDDGGSERLTIRLGAGADTQLIGACDTDCSDLDLTLYDSSGEEVDSDLQLDDFPIVSAHPARNATFTVLVQMVECGADPCRYAVQQFVR